MWPVLRFGEEKRVSVHLVSPDLASFEEAKSNAIGNPHLMGIYT